MQREFLYITVIGRPSRAKTDSILAEARASVGNTIEAMSGAGDGVKPHVAEPGAAQAPDSVQTSDIEWAETDANTETAYYRQRDKELDETRQHLKEFGYSNEQINQGVRAYLEGTTAVSVDPHIIISWMLERQNKMKQVARPVVAPIQHDNPREANSAEETKTADTDAIHRMDAIQTAQKLSRLQFDDAQINRGISKYLELHPSAETVGFDMQAIVNLICAMQEKEGIEGIESDPELESESAWSHGEDNAKVG